MPQTPATDSCFTAVVPSVLSVCAPLGDNLRRRHEYDCIVAVYTAESRAAAVVSVVLFADACQQLLELSAWPARDLCVHFDPGADFPVWIGSACDTPCYFGTEDATDATVCVCDHGYWNVSCDSECPGGAADPCSGVGRCRPDTGRCECPVNRRGDEDCATCSPGWYGTDCTVTYAPGAAGLGRLSATAQLRTLSGLTTRVSAEGELLLLALRPFLLLQAKLVRCHAYFSCVAFVAIRLGDDAHGYAEISLHVTSSLVLTATLEGEAVMLDRTHHFHGFTVRRLSAGEVGVEAGGGVRVTVRALGRHLHTSVRVDRALLSLTTGLLSGRDVDTLADASAYIVSVPDQPPPGCGALPVQTPRSDPVVGSLPLATATPPPSSITPAPTQPLSAVALELYALKWRVAACELVISYPSAAHAAHGRAGYALHFNGSSAVVALPPRTVIGENVTIEMSVQLTHADGGGVLFSYSNNRTFALLSKAGALHVHYDGVTNATNLALPDAVWTRLAVVYEGATGVLDVYVFGPDGTPLRQTTLLPPGVFSAGGSLALGQWQPPSSGRRAVPLRPLVGRVDNLMVWAQKIDATLIKDVWRIGLSDRLTLLTAVWLFDEGQLASAGDLRTGRALGMLGAPWATPQWRPSGAAAVEETITQPLALHCRSAAHEGEARTVCEETIAGVTRRCNDSAAAVDMYRLFCEQDYCQGGGGALAARSVAYDFADACQLAANASAWPAAELCDDMLRSGTECGGACRFGTVGESGECVCEMEYAGENCTEACPGDSAGPCRAHGRCNASAQCECDDNWAGVDCGACAPGWRGPHCALLQLAVPPNASFAETASLSPSATLHTFDGLLYVVPPGVSGVLTLFRAADLHIQVRLSPCPIGACVVAVAVARNDSVVTVYADDDDWPSVYAGDTALDARLTTARLDNDLTVSRVSRHTLIIRAVAPPVRCTLRVMQRYVHVTVEAGRDACEASDGLLGSCDGNQDNDVPFDPDKATAAVVASAVSSDHQVAPPDSLFRRDNSSRLPPSAGFALAFDNTAGTTAPLSYRTVQRRRRAVVPDGDVSISLLLRPLTDGGVVFSYGGDSTFALLNTRPVSLQCGATVIVTRGRCNLGDWHQVVLAYERAAARVHFYLFGAAGGLSYEVFAADACTDFMTPGGRVTLGGWQPAPDGQVNR